jgi:hypothetical protein
VLVATIGATGLAVIPAFAALNLVVARKGRGTALVAFSLVSLVAAVFAWAVLMAIMRSRLEVSAIRAPSTVQSRRGFENERSRAVSIFCWASRGSLVMMAMTNSPLAFHLCEILKFSRPRPWAASSTAVRKAAKRKVHTHTYPVQMFR